MLIWLIIQIFLETIPAALDQVYQPHPVLAYPPLFGVDLSTPKMTAIRRQRLILRRILAEDILDTRRMKRRII